jgi:hypothetical protein
MLVALTSCSDGESSAGAAVGDELPCAVSRILERSCRSCHGATPQHGAPMSLVTLEDLNGFAKSQPDRPVRELVLERVQDRAQPMPPDPTQRLGDSAIAALREWVGSGGQPGEACEASPAAEGGDDSPPGAPTSGRPGADGETCYELRAHGQPVRGDTSSYTVPAGEHYTGFFFRAPWSTPVQGLRVRHLSEDSRFVHHWLLYADTADLADSEIDECSLAGVSGLFCGEGPTRTLITGWAPGQLELQLPADVGLELPAPGTALVLEMHYYNPGDPAGDRSGMEVCVTDRFRPHAASVTWLGSRAISVPPHGTSTASGTCNPGRAGLSEADPIHIMWSWPHMHKSGRHMSSIVHRTSGEQEVLHDADFSFSHQVTHDTPMLLRSGDSITTTCTYENTTDQPVGFGLGSDKEMCYNFVYAWPAHALDHPGADAGESLSSCLH